MKENIKEVNNKENLVNFLTALAQDAETNLSQWENQTISAYLEAIAGWINDYSVSAENDIDLEKLDHNILAQIFYIGKIYE